MRDAVNYDTAYYMGAYGNNVSPNSNSKKRYGLEIFQLVRSARDRESTWWHLYRSKVCTPFLTDSQIFITR